MKEVTPRVWEQQREIDLLVAHGFAVFQRVPHLTGQTIYVWTEEGREACFRNRYSTPMAWADDMHFKRARHCVVCGRDCYRKKVWAHDGRFLCVCLSCGATGHGPGDIVQEEEKT